jgi:hypothetical protein
MKRPRGMGSYLGAAGAAAYALAFAAAFVEYTRASGQWPDAEWLFLVALPYTLTMVKLKGSVDFSGESVAAVLPAAAFCCALAYAAGAVLEAICRGVFRGARRLIPRA